MTVTARFLEGSMCLIAAHIRARIGRSFYLVLTTAIAAAVLMSLAALMPESMPSGSMTPTAFVANVRDGLLPLRYAARIAEMPDVVGVSYLDYLPVLCSAGGTVTLNGFAGNDTAAMLRRDYGADAATLGAWDADPLGVLIGEKLAKQCGWSLGMHPAPHDGMRGREVEIHIVGILRGTSDTPFAEHIAVAHYEYLDRLADEDQRNRVAGIIVRAADPAGTAVLAARIDERFAHFDPPTETQQSGDSESGLRRFGKVQVVLGWVMAAMYACIVLVTVSMMGHVASERRTTFIVLRSLGFSRRFLVGIFAGEFALLMAAGVTLGTLFGLVFVVRTAPTLAAVVGTFAVPAWAWRALLPAFAFVLAAGLLAPIGIVVRLRTCRRIG